MKLLCLLPRVSFPAIDGARKANCTFLQGLTQNPDFKVTTLSIAPENEKANLEAFRTHCNLEDVLFYPRPDNGSGLKKYVHLLFNFLSHPGTPVTYQAFYSSSLYSYLIKLIKAEKFDAVIAITPHTGMPLLMGPIPVPFLYRSENVEYELWEKRALEEKNFLLKIFLKFQASLVERLELSLIKKANLTLTIAKEDKTTYVSVIPECENKIFTLPMGVHFPQMLPFVESKNSTLQLFFLGKLDWGPNSDGLIWFLKEVWPHVRHQNLELSIAGSGEVSRILPYTQDPKIKFLGLVENLTPHFELAHLLLVPVFYGSGTRIKVLEAASFARPCLSTALGIQGSPLTHNPNSYLLAETEEEWIHFIETVKPDMLKTMGELAYKEASSEIEFYTTAKKSAELIRKHLSR